MCKPRSLFITQAILVSKEIQKCPLQGKKLSNLELLSRLPIIQYMAKVRKAKEGIKEA